jgi:hypothetical protein
MNNEYVKHKQRHALNTPHELFVVDQLLKIKNDGQLVQVTLGWESPNEAFNPIATLVMAKDFAKQFADALRCSEE